jgi:hypothetical protein
MINRVVAFALAASCFGCSFAPKVDHKQLPRSFPWVSAHEVTVQRGQAPDSPVFLSCYNTNGGHEYLRRSANRDRLLRIAKQSYKYALLASNAYHSEAQFRLPGWVATAHYRGLSSGFQADLYVNASEKRLALVFRGTDNTRDRSANFSLWFGGSEHRAPQQYQLADNLARSLRSDPSYQGYRLTLVGHSLGGALAAHAGWFDAQAELYLFDPSPRTWRDGPPATSDLYVVRESGEILTYLFFWKRIPVPEDNEAAYNVIDGSAVREHNMYYLARSLLLIAATEGSDAEARALMDQNLDCDKHQGAPAAQ